MTTHRRHGRDWLTECLASLAPEDRPGATLALLAGQAPNKITEADVIAWRGDTVTDHCLLHLLAYGAFLAVQRIEARITN